MTEAAKGRMSAVAADAEQFTGLVLEEVFATLKQKPVMAIGMAMPTMLGSTDVCGSAPGREGAD